MITLRTLISYNLINLPLLRTFRLITQAVDQRFKSLGDGRKACSECMESAVMTTTTCQPLYQEILNFYKTNLDMPMKQQVPMLLVEREALNNASEHEKDVRVSSLSTSKLRSRKWGLYYTTEFEVAIVQFTTVSLCVYKLQ